MSHVHLKNESTEKKAFLSFEKLKKAFLSFEKNENHRFADYGTNFFIAHLM